MDSISYVVAVLLIVWVVVRQYRGRFASDRLIGPLPLIISFFGVLQLVSATVQWTTAAIATVAAELVLTVLLGAARAAAVRLSERDGYLYQRGTWLLIGLWIVSIAARLAPVPLLSGTAAAATAATLTLSLGLSLVVQSVVLGTRVRADGRPVRPGAADRRAAAAGSRLDR